MIIDSIKIRNLKIIDSLDIEFSKWINLITGENRIGKTTVIIGINVAFSGKLKKHLINHNPEINGCYIECSFRHEKKRFKVIRQFFKSSSKSAKAKLFIDDKLYSKSTAQINEYMQDNFKFFFSLGFLYYSKIGKLLVEYNIKKNDFLIEFFELQNLIKLNTAVNKTIRVNKNMVPDWFYDYEDHTKDIEKYSNKIEKIRLKMKKITKKLTTFNDKIGNIKKFKDKQILTEAEYKLIQKKHNKVLAHISGLETKLDAKTLIVTSINKINNNDNICPTCLRPFSNKDCKGIKTKIEKELKKLEVQINELEDKGDKLDDKLRKSTISDTKVSFEKLNLYVEKAQKYETIHDELQEMLFELKHRIENWKTEKYNYETVMKKVKEKQTDVLNKFGRSLADLIATLAEKIKEDLLHKMNEFLAVIYNGEVFISLNDGQFYLLQNDHEILFDDISASGSELEIITFIFVLSLSIICGNKVVILDEIFNTTSKSTFDQVNRLINYSKKYFKQTIIISHKETFEADNTIYL